MLVSPTVLPKYHGHSIPVTITGNITILQRQSVVTFGLNAFKVIRLFFLQGRTVTPVMRVGAIPIFWSGSYWLHYHLRNYRWFVAAISIITNTPNTTMAYACSSSSSTHITNTQTGVSGSSGSCSSSSSSSARGSVSHISAASATVLGPNTKAAADSTLFINGAEASSSSSSGGAQSSCSSSSSTSVGGAFSSSSSQSQPGSCP